MTSSPQETYPLIFSHEDDQESIRKALEVSDIPPPPARPKRHVNTVFLKNVLSQAEGHNAVLLKRERDEQLGLRKHPLIDKIRTIEAEKLERAQRDRRNRIEERGNIRHRSRSPRSREKSIDTKKHRLDKSRRDDARLSLSKEEDTGMPIRNKTTNWQCGAGYL